MVLNQKQKNKSVLITGGHGATTGIALIEGLRNKYNYEIKISWIGSKQAVSGSKVASLEHKIYPTLGIDYHSIDAGKMQTKFTRYTIPLFLKIPLGFIESLFMILKIKPNVIVSLGGYASFPVVFWGWFFNVPVILHEQTSVAGRTSRLSAFFANKIAISRASSKKYFSAGKTILTGNPIRKEILDLKLAFKKVPNTILIMGGSRGSEFINQQILKIIPELTKKYKIIHITGERDFDKYKKHKKPNYDVRAFVEPDQMGEIYNHSDLIISRSGANSVSEILFVKKPAIFIPLPRTYLDEQYKNAIYASSFGFTWVLNEDEVENGALLKKIDEIFNNYTKIVDASRVFVSSDLYATSKLTDLIAEYLK